MEKFAEECSSCGLTIFDEELSELGAIPGFPVPSCYNGKRLQRVLHDALVGMGKIL